MEKIIIAFEGLPNSGKTSCIKQLTKINKEILYVPELYIKQEVNHPNLMREKYTKAELNKYKKYQDKENKIIVMDRSFLSTLAFSYAKKQRYGKSNDYKYNIRFLKDNINNMLFPNIIIIFDIKPSNSLIRNKRENQLKNWEDINFLKSFKNYYISKEFKKISKNINIFLIDTNNLSDNKIMGEVKKIIETIHK